MINNYLVLEAVEEVQASNSVNFQIEEVRLRHIIEIYI